jgi:hypothetical protein
VSAQNPPTGTHAVNATVGALQELLAEYDQLRALRDDTEPSLPKYDAIERRLAGMRRQATKLIGRLDPAPESWRRAFGLV